MNTKFFSYFFISFFSINGALANEYCASLISEERFEFQLKPLPIETCLLQEDYNKIKYYSNEKDLEQFKTIEEWCEYKGLITAEKLINELENKNPSIICTVNYGTLKECITPWGGEVAYDWQTDYFNFRVFGFVDKNKNIIELSPSKRKGYSGMLVFHLEKPSKSYSNIVDFVEKTPGVWKGKCSEFNEIIGANKLKYIGKLENIKYKMNYLLNGNRRSMGAAIKHYYKFDPPIIIPDNQGNF